MNCKNAGKGDRIARVILGVILLAVGHYTKNFWFAFGLIPLITGLVGYCPLYSLFGFKTCPMEKK